MSADESAPIYTKTGDDGSTGRLFGGRVSKGDPVIELCGIARTALRRAAGDDEERLSHD